MLFNYSFTVNRYFCFFNVSQKNGYDFLPKYILISGSKETFSIVENGKAAKIYVDPSDWKVVIRAAKDYG
jgi:hypothetical protein